jgi:16S rRNA (cytidine1402-2'-O)-methyltransferase
MVEVFGPDRSACVARELTKLHEEVARGTLTELAENFEKKATKGEIVILVAPPEQEEIQNTETLLMELMQTMSVSKAAAEAATLTGGSKRDLYQQALTLKEKHER